ncbi:MULTISPECIES: GspH/FimT family pseudopilin [Pseudoalteromonas]|uniref:GspH/FimT family pseudopilin n=1 Tax=Pseudoalteromonas TaxID=53246 RepID=UPI00035E5DC6|nr:MULTISPECIES: GspH/FimT family pseudopilin [Pseudoalteromonas]MCF6143602.1 type IV fimbrial biogenesis protein FimT [Pseudoalteromonas mariniglutinosa NCIMB 1770]TMN71352.1 pilus assembly protein [Pseudoalteromonas sp. S1727]
MRKTTLSSPHSGTTLIEIMVIVSILAILANLALFHLHPFFAQIRLENYGHLIKRTLSLARTNAISLNSQITVCSLASSVCDSSRWHQGLTVFVDKDEVGVFGDNDTVILVTEAINESDMLTYPRDAVTYRPDGTPRGFDNGTFVYCAEYKSAELAGIAISVSTTGKTTLKDTEQCQTN